MPWYAIYIEGSPALLLALVVGCAVGLRFRSLVGSALASLTVTVLLACIALPAWFRLCLALRGNPSPPPALRDLGLIAFEGLLFSFPVGLVAAALSVALWAARRSRHTKSIFNIVLVVFGLLVGAAAAFMERMAEALKLPTAAGLGMATGSALCALALVGCGLYLERSGGAQG